MQAPKISQNAAWREYIYMYMLMYEQASPEGKVRATSDSQTKIFPEDLKFSFKLYMYTYPYKVKYLNYVIL